MLSSCLGKPMMGFFHGLWDSSIHSARIGSDRMTRRRRELGEDDLWEMEYRGRGRAG